MTWSGPCDLLGWGGGEGCLSLWVDWASGGSPKGVRWVTPGYSSTTHLDSPVPRGWTALNLEPRVKIETALRCGGGAIHTTHLLSYEKPVRISEKERKKEKGDD